jgi:hypothetical protein
LALFARLGVLIGQGAMVVYLSLPIKMGEITEAQMLSPPAPGPQGAHDPETRIFSYQDGRSRVEPGPGEM